MAPEFTRMAQRAHAHAVLGHGVGHVRRKPARLHRQWWRQVQNMRVTSCLCAADQRRQAGLRTGESFTHVDARLIALALLIRMSIPPKRSIAARTASAIAASMRMSVGTTRAWPPAASICAAAL